MRRQSSVIGVIPSPRFMSTPKINAAIRKQLVSKGENHVSKFPPYLFELDFTAAKSCQIWAVEIIYDRRFPSFCITLTIDITFFEPWPAAIA